MEDGINKNCIESCRVLLDQLDSRADKFKLAALIRDLMYTSFGIPKLYIQDVRVQDTFTFNLITKSLDICGNYGFYEVYAAISLLLDHPVEYFLALRLHKLKKQDI